MIGGSIVHGTVSSAAVIIILLVGWVGVKRGGDWGKHCAWNSKQYSSGNITVSLLGGVKK